MIFVAGANIDRHLVKSLHNLGHAVHSVKDIDGRLPDDGVLALARNLGAVLLTADKDFGELVIRHRMLAHGVVLVRMPGFHPEARATEVSTRLNRLGEKILGAFTVMTPGQTRIRKLRRT